jgi:formylglycine-generating enzyme required for sulfatase activity
MPSEDGKHAYLLPVDGNSSLEGSGLSTASLYKQLGGMPSRATIVFLDACFSGARRDGQMLASSRGVAIKAKNEPVSGNVVVFSAAQGDETAYPYKEKQHGLFTYYLLEQMQSEGGNVSLGDLAENVKKQVGRTSIVENDKSQTPTVTASSTITDWRKWILAHKRAGKYETVRRTTPITPTEQTSPATVPVANRSTAPRQTLQGQVFTVEGVQFTMIPVKGGTFMMGATDEQGAEAFENEKPVHQVTLSDFYIGETEVTQELWEAVLGKNPSELKGGKRPVENVSWDDCQIFIKELNALTGQKFRLPSEAEWEYAARGGQNDVVSKYAGSNNAISKVAWLSDNSNSSTHDVKTKKANELGIYDMSGNVWEWCQDWYGKYGSSAQTNPQGPASGSGRVFRGGGWSYDAWHCRVSNRGYYTSSFHFSYLGLRLAL